MGEKKKEGGRANTTCRVRHTTNRQIRKQEKEPERSYRNTSMLFVNKGDSIKRLAIAIPLRMNSLMQARGTLHSETLSDCQQMIHRADKTGISTIANKKH